MKSTDHKSKAKENTADLMFSNYVNQIIRVNTTTSNDNEGKKIAN